MLTLDRSLSNLYVLLRAPSFSRLPLKILFFYGEVYEAWRKKCLRLARDVRDDLQTLYSPFGNSHLLVDQDSIEAVDESYSPLLPHLEKSQHLLADVIECRCSICDGTIGEQRMVITCSIQDCKMLSHITCLSKAFLGGKGDSSVLPVSGDCPRCKTRLQWVDLVKELSLRTRGPLIVEKLKRRAKRQKLKALGLETAATLDTASETSELEDASDTDITDSDPNSDSDSWHIDQEDRASSSRDISDPFGEDAWNDWHHIAGEDDAIVNIGAKNDVALSPLRLSNDTRSKLNLPMVIEDSEGDGAEALE